MLPARHAISTRVAPVITVLLRGLASAPEDSLPVLIDSDNVIRSPLSDVVIPDKNVAEYVWRNADRWKDKPALTDAVTGHSFTYREGRGATERLSLSLPQVTGLKPGDAIGLVMPNCPEFALTLLGAAGAGLIVTPANPAYTAEELSRQFRDAGAKAVVTVPPLLDKVRDALELSGGAQLIVSCTSEADEAQLGSDVLSLRALLSREYTRRTPRLPRPDPDQLAVLPYSSGTTGLPKGVRITHRNLVANLCQVEHPDVFPVKNRFGEQNVGLCILPLYHIYGMNAVLNVGLCLGRHMVTIPRFEAQMFADAFAKYKPTVLSVVPPLLLFFANTDLLAPEDLARLHSVMTGAAPATPALIEKFAKKVDLNVCDFKEGYGLTETSPVVNITPHRRFGHRKLGSCGVPVPLTEIKIVNEAGHALPQGDEGELLVRGPQIMQGYHNNESATRDTLTEDGWLRTGDVARVDEDGHVFIVDRIKELIKVKGLQVSPTELEGVLRKLDGVADVAVVGIPDERSGEVPRAFVVRANNSQISETDVLHYMESRVAPFKRLAGGVRFVDEIPKSAAGKTLRKPLRDMK